MCMLPALGLGLGGMGTALTIGASVIGAAGQMQNANAEAAAYEKQAELAKIQAAEEEAASLDFIKAGKEETDRRRRAGAVVKGNQIAALAANGVDVNGDLAIGLIDDTDTITADDAFAIRENARFGAEGQTQKARNTRWRAANNKTMAANTRSAGVYAAFDTLLTGASKVGSRYNHYSNSAED